MQAAGLSPGCFCAPSCCGRTWGREGARRLCWAEVARGVGAGAGLEGQKDGGAPPVTASEGDAAPGVAAERRGRGQGRGGGSVPQECPSQRQPLSWGQHFPPPHSRTSCFTRRGPQSAAGAHPSASPSPRGWLAPPGLSRCHPPEGNRRDGTDGALPGLRALRAQGGPGAGFGTSAPAAPPLPAPGRTPAPAPGEQHSESSTQGLSRAEGFAPLPITAALRMRAPFCPAPTAPGRQLLFCSAPILARDRAGSGAASLLHEAWPGRGAELGGTGLEPTPLPRPAPFCLPPQLAQPGPCRRTAQSRGSAPSRPRSCGVQHDRCTNLPVPSLNPRTAELSRSRRTERGIHLLSPSAAAAEPTPSRQRHPCDSARLSSPCQAGGTRGHGRADGRREVRG